LAAAISRNDFEQTKKLLAEQTGNIDALRPQEGSTLLSTAALYGRADIAEYLIERGADVNAANRDGNTPLHVAAFLCRTEIVQLLLENGGSVSKKNMREETPIDVVSSPWSRSLADFYVGIGNAVGLELDLERIKRQRPQRAEQLRKHDTKSSRSLEENHTDT